MSVTVYGDSLQIAFDAFFNIGERFYRTTGDLVFEIVTEHEMGSNLEILQNGSRKMTTDDSDIGYRLVNLCFILCLDEHNLQ